VVGHREAAPGRFHAGHAGDYGVFCTTRRLCSALHIWGVVQKTPVWYSLRSCRFSACGERAWCCDLLSRMANLHAASRVSCLNSPLNRCRYRMGPSRI
jgi:hypothetical protein